MFRRICTILFLCFIFAIQVGCGDFFAKQKAILSVQNYRAGKNGISFKSWLEGRNESRSNRDTVWEAGRLKRGLWVVQITFMSETYEEHFLYLVDLQSGRIRGADSGFSEQTLKEFEESSPEYI